jgi:hypothetical protein
VWAFSAIIDPVFAFTQHLNRSLRWSLSRTLGTRIFKLNKEVFTLMTVPVELEAKVDRRPFDKVMADSAKSMDFSPEKHVLFLSFRLPWQQSFDLLRLVAKLGVNASTVFPGYGGPSKL